MIGVGPEMPASAEELACRENVRRRLWERERRDREVLERYARACRAAGALWAGIDGLVYVAHAVIGRSPEGICVGEGEWFGAYFLNGFLLTDVELDLRPIFAPRVPLLGPLQKEYLDEVKRGNVIIVGGPKTNELAAAFGSELGLGPVRSPRAGHVENRFDRTALGRMLAHDWHDCDQDVLPESCLHPVLDGPSDGGDGATGYPSLLAPDHLAAPSAGEPAYGGEGLAYDLGYVCKRRNPWNRDKWVLLAIGQYSLGTRGAACALYLAELMVELADELAQRGKHVDDRGNVGEFSCVVRIDRLPGPDDRVQAQIVAPYKGKQVINPAALKEQSDLIRLALRSRPGVWLTPAGATAQDQEQWARQFAGNYVLAVGGREYGHGPTIEAAREAARQTIEKEKAKVAVEDMIVYAF